MQEVAHDGAMRDFGVVGVGIVDGVILALAHVRRERFPVVGLLRVVRRAVTFDELAQPRIRAGRVVGMVRERENVFVLADGESLDLAELRVFEFLGEQLQVVLLPRLLAGESQAETLHRAGGLGGEVEIGLAHGDCLTTDDTDEPGCRRKRDRSYLTPALSLPLRGPEREKRSAAASACNSWMELGH